MLSGNEKKLDPIKFLLNIGNKMEKELKNLSEQLKRQNKKNDLIDESELILQQKKYALINTKTGVIDYYLSLLRTATTLNMKNDLLSLLELNWNGFEKFKIDNIVARDRSEPCETLLGIAAFHGHMDLVKFLVEKKSANINTADAYGNTPLHRVVYGDSSPYQVRSIGNAHGEIAKYLIEKDGNFLMIKNHHGKTPYELAKVCAPYLLEKLLNINILTPIKDPIYHYTAAKVWPVFVEYSKLKSLKPIAEVKTFSQCFLEEAISDPITPYELENTESLVVTKKFYPFAMVRFFLDITYNNKQTTSKEVDFSTLNYSINKHKGYYEKHLGEDKINNILDNHTTKPTIEESSEPPNCVLQ